jgi:tetratricopeptide (TPR) repeat protein
MGRLLNPDLWQSGLSEHPAEHAALQQWIKDVDGDLEIIKWFEDGRSSYPVALVLRTGRTTPQQLVMKFCDRGRRTRALDEAWNASPEYRENHLAKKVQDPIPLGKWQAVFFRIAGDDIEEYRPLSEYRRDPSLPECLRLIVTSMIRDWNERTSSPEKPTAGNLLRPIIAHRIADAEDWARHKGLAVDATSPFALVSGADADLTVQGPLIGKAHGDLSARNIFVRRGKKLKASSYVLIDYDHFGEERLLAFDPMHLVVALALDDFNLYDAEIRADWIRVMVDPDEPDFHVGAGPMRKICREVHAGAFAAFPGHGLPNLWRQQLLLGLVGAGLLHIGRKLHTKSPDEARQWCYDLTAAAAQALRRKLTAATPEHKEEASSIPSASRRRRHRRMINRETEQAALRRRLTTGPFGAVVLHGLAGIGKSQVLDVVLDSLRDSDAATPTRVYQRVVDAATRLDLKTFIDALEGRATSCAAPGQASLARLESVLGGLGDRPVTLALDGAENLLKQGTDELADLDLDEALEFLTADQEHRVSVVLVFREIPTSPTGGAWPQVTGPIAIPRLEIEEFFDFFDYIDHDGILRLNRLDSAFRRKLHGRLQGNPRNAELVVALVTFADRSLGLAELADRLFQWNPAEVSSKLVRLLAERLGSLRGSVVETLAAFGTPISGQAVASALDGEHRAGDVEQALTVLTGKRVVYQNENDDYYLPEPSTTVILEHLDDERRVALMEAAARVLAEIPDGPVTAVHDLRIRFAQLNALLNAGCFTDAYGVIEKIYRHLYDWNCGHLLTKQRRRVRLRLGDDHLEMANENELADIYVSTGDSSAANEAFGRALKKAEDLGDDPNRQKLLLNMANWYFDTGETNRARGYFELVRDDLEGAGDLSVRMGALEGLADCDRRQGRYADAIEHAENALVLGKTDFSGDPTAAAYAAAGTVYTVMKLSRWYAEMGNLRKAAALMQEADTAAGGESVDWLRAARLDGWADLLLAQGDLPGSISAAEEAVDLARATYDGVVLLQAHTTLCVAHLHNGNTGRARRDIQRAQLHRKRDRRGRSLLIVALQALITLQIGDPKDAALLFRRLADESKHRTADPQDFAAHDMLGFAICGLAVVDDADVTSAEALFREMRRQVPGTPGLVSRLRFLVETLDACGSSPSLLRPALDALRTGG